MKCPITGKSCLKHKAFESGGHLVCEECLQKNTKAIHSVGDDYCPSCGISLADIVKGSRFGCAFCYNSFPDMIPHLIASVQIGDSSLRHTGRTPDQFLKLQSKSISQEDIRKEILMRMNSASSNNNYEEAERMKSKIKELNSLIKDEQADFADRLAHFVFDFWKELSERID